MPATPRWSTDQVLALAPDPAAAKAGRGLGRAAPWRETGFSTEPGAVWGLCQGSGTRPYQTCVELSEPEPAYQCSCPSRKFPCKHALGLLLLWSDGAVDPASAPDWVNAWLTSRGERQQNRTERTAKKTDPAVTAASQARRAQRVEAGVAELEGWLADSIRQGLATAIRGGYERWDSMAARLVDAQAPGLAGAVRRLAGFTGTPERLLGELGLVWLLARAYRRIDELPAELAATVRSRVGFPVATEDVLAGPRVRDEWAVVGLRDEADDRLTVRRVWLHGVTTGQPALVLTFTPAGQPLPTDLISGTSIEADLCFYPGAQPLRALVAHHYEEPRRLGGLAGAADATEVLLGYARALAAEPWLDRWPVVLNDAVLARDDRSHWQVVDRTGGALPVERAGGDPWRLVAATGGAPGPVAGEWSPAGLRLLSAWADDRLVPA